jgi:hypothetical protein
MARQADELASDRRACDVPASVAGTGIAEYARHPPRLGGVRVDADVGLRSWRCRAGPTTSRRSA